MTLADLRLMQRGEQLRFNKMARLLAWAVSVIAQVQASAGGAKKHQIRRLSWDRLLMSVPGYDPRMEQSGD